MQRVLNTVAIGVDDVTRWCLHTKARILNKFLPQNAQRVALDVAPATVFADLGTRWKHPTEFNIQSMASTRSRSSF